MAQVHERMMVRVAAVILNWNNPKDTIRCLNSLKSAQQYLFQIIVVDNASTDDSLKCIRAEHPDVVLLRNERNLGYAGGNNVGIAYALEQDADFVLLLNDDIVVAPGSIETLIAATARYPKAGFLGPKIVSLENTSRILSAGGSIKKDGTIQHRNVVEHDLMIHEPVIDVDFLSGSALMVSRRAIERVGMLDESFFVYGEDVEWCYRGKLAGFQVLLVSDAVVFHPDTRQRDRHSALVMYYISRNHLLFLQKHHFGLINIAKILFRDMKLLANWTFNPKWRDAKPKRDALMLAMRDFVLGRFGKGPDF
jgi:GT2 family glycosyltransferase